MAECLVRAGLFKKRRLRVDLHGVSVFGPGSDHVLIRWEWVERVESGEGGAVVASASDEVRFPAGAFGCSPGELAQRLERARSITDRSDVIASLGSDG